jgi:erythromycin esterase
VIEEIRELASPLGGDPGDLDRLVERAARTRHVLIGEASHGTADYYVWRAELTKRLVVEHGFSFVAVEGDWPDCFEVDRWVKGRSSHGLGARDVLAGFERWPTWMWANEEVASFLGWLRDHNHATGQDVGFYGLDVYSLWESLDRIVRHLTEHDPASVDAAISAFRCFEPFAEDPQEYARATVMVPTTCQDEVVDLLVALQRRAALPDCDPDAELDALQNAEVLAGAERYYRSMIRGDAESWNVRDCHMADTFDRLVAHHGPDARGIVWEHNTHVGDARATDMARAGMVNVGQLVRERYGEDAVLLVGFSGHRGTVIAAPRWGAPPQRLASPPAPRDSHEDLLHHALGDGAALLVFPDRRDADWLREQRGHRAIGVVYHPERDPYGSWVPTVIGRRYDALISLGATEALSPLAR